MYIVTYRFTLPPDNTKEYIMIEQKAIQIYLEHGCLGVEIYRDSENPRKWLEVNRFLDQKHLDDVVAAVEEDTRIASLFDEFLSLFDNNRAPEKDTYIRML
ncbi:MAG: antibiotic biosynthesis monooxygenase [Candidatus Bathyarchaeota archaeon]|nr:MAG: antibiotic biosynthesis monooxygenase [Candidatus Bathyarchaeota archaeon]